MNNIPRREFLDRSKKSAVGLAASLPVLAGATVSHAAQDSGKHRPTVMCVYYPHWHNYDHGTAWKGEGWTEWEGVKAAIPRFPGHQQPLKPTWGYFDESGPEMDGARDRSCRRSWNRRVSLRLVLVQAACKICRRPWNKASSTLRTAIA